MQTSELVLSERVPVDLWGFPGMPGGIRRKPVRSRIGWQSASPISPRLVTALDTGELAAMQLNEVWSMDLVSGQLPNSRRLKCPTVADGFNDEAVQKR